MKEKIRKYLTNAYKVYNGQKVEAVVGICFYHVDQPLGARPIVARKEFFEKITKKHSEVTLDSLFFFVQTINIPDEVYKTSLDGRLNFFRKISNSHSTNVVATKQVGNTNVLVTTFITSKSNYMTNIRKTAEAVFLRNPEGTAISPICDVIADSRADFLSSG